MYCKSKELYLHIETTKKHMKNVIKLTAHSWDSEVFPVLIGTESIIKARPLVLKHYDGRSVNVTEIESMGAMVTTTYVTESVEEIYKLIDNN